MPECVAVQSQKAAIAYLEYKQLQLLAVTFDFAEQGGATHPSTLSQGAIVIGYAAQRRLKKALCQHSANGGPTSRGSD